MWSHTAIRNIDPNPLETKCISYQPCFFLLLYMIVAYGTIPLMESLWINSLIKHPNWALHFTVPANILWLLRSCWDHSSSSSEHFALLVLKPTGIVDRMRIISAHIYSDGLALADKSIVLIQKLLYIWACCCMQNDVKDPSHPPEVGVVL